jgi:hypothetical protein
MTTTKARADQNGQPEPKADTVHEQTEPNPLLTNQPPPQQVPQPNYEAQIRQVQAEARFWKKKYIEQMANHAQVVGALSQSFLAEEAMSQLASGNPEIAAKIAEMQAAQQG